MSTDYSQQHYDPFTGELVERCTAVATRVAQRLEPPRFCVRCGRRMVVQVRPDGWWAQCSRHGRLDSTSLPEPADPTSAGGPHTADDR